MTEIHSCSYYCERPECIKAQRDELRDRLAQPEQEPVALVIDGVLVKSALPEKYTGHLYTSPPQRKPLTDEKVERLIYENTKINPNVADDRELLGYIVNAARAIEAAHGIKENT